MAREESTSKLLTQLNVNIVLMALLFFMTIVGHSQAWLYEGFVVRHDVFDRLGWI